MKLIIATLLVFFSFGAFAETTPLDTKINLEAKRIPLKQVLKTISDQSKIRVKIDKSVNLRHRVNVRVKEMKVRDILDHTLASADATWIELMDGSIEILPKSM